MRLSVILPTYNERRNIRCLVERVERALHEIPHELIFVDDSTDGTDIEIAAQAQQCPHIALIHRAKRSGLATAVIEGFRLARGDAICVLLEALEQAEVDLVAASRSVAGGSYGPLPAGRRWSSRAATMIARFLLTRARLVSDPMSGFFVVRSAAIRGVTLEPLGYKILLEILVRGRVRRAAEIPYQFQARRAGVTKLTVRQQWEYLLHLLRLVTVHPDDLRFLRFCCVGASGTLVNMALLWALATRGLYYVTAGVTAAAVATTWNFLLNDATTWRDRQCCASLTKPARYIRYVAVAGTSSAIQVALLFTLTTAGVPYLLSNLIGIGTAAIWNFEVNNIWTWRSSPHAHAYNVEGNRARDLQLRARHEAGQK